MFSEKRTRPIGLVQTPQFFYNVNPDEDVWDHLNVSFFHRIEPSLDRWSAVNCCGTNFVVRADALKDVGYFPVGCLTEDTLLSLRLCTMGWGVAYHHEVLAIGQSPHEITEIFKQRSRWCKGNLQIFLDEFPLMQSGLSLSQRIFYSSCGFNYFCASISIPFFQLVPAWAIFFGLWPVSKIGLEFAFAFFIYYLLGNVLLLFPPPGFGIRDMWNGELASTNLWFTYFNGVRRIVGTKLLKGKGKLIFFTKYYVQFAFPCKMVLETAALGDAYKSSTASTNSTILTQRFDYAKSCCGTHSPTFWSFLLRRKGYTVG